MTLEGWVKRKHYRFKRERYGTRVYYYQQKKQNTEWQFITLNYLNNMYENT